MGRTYGQLQKKLEGFLTDHLAGLENEERVEALTWYCQGLGLEIPNKTALGIATRFAPNDVQACRQRIQRALARGRFEHDDVFSRLQRTLFRDGAKGIQAYCIDDTGFAKKGKASAGVQRQYSGTLGKVGNCQVAVTLHGMSEEFSACLAGQLYLPEAWTSAPQRLSDAGVPQHIEFATKPDIAIELLTKAKENGAPNRPVIADAGYGDSRDFRESVRKLGWHFGVAISSNTNVWSADCAPQRPARTGKVGRPRTQDRDPSGKKPIRVDKLAKKHWDDGEFRSITWRKGAQKPLCAQFCAVRVKSAERRTKGLPASEALWLLIERDKTETTGFKYYLLSLPEKTSLKKLIKLIKLRWHIERDYQDMKQKLGLDSYEGRTWGGFHRHLAMVALVHAFLSLHRESFSPRCLETLDLGTISSRPSSRTAALGRTMPNLPENIR